MRYDTTTQIPNHMRNALIQSAGNVIAQLAWADTHESVSLRDAKRAIEVAEHSLQVLKDQVNKGICQANYDNEIDRRFQAITRDQ